MPSKQQVFFNKLFSGNKSLKLYLNPPKFLNATSCPCKIMTVPSMSVNDGVQTDTYTHKTHNYICFFLFSDLKEFLNNQKDYWMSKQKEVEERFMEVDKEGQDPDLMAPKPRKRKRTTKEVPPSKDDPYARFAAELQTIFFTKVSSTI